MGISVLNASLMCGPPENGFTKAMRETFTGAYWPLNPGTPNFNQELISLVKNNKIDCIFLQIQTPNVLSVETAREIAKHSFVLQFSGDIRWDTEPFYYDIGHEIHLTTFSNLRDVKNCRERGIKAEWLELGYDPEIFKPRREIPKEYDIVAHFNDYGDQFPLGQFRRDIVTKLKEEFGERFKVFGNFPGASGNFNSDQIAESINYNKARIAINCSNVLAERYSSDRLLRICGSMTTCVSHRFSGLEDMYPDGCIEHFDTLDQMIERCKILLNSDYNREEMAKRAQKHALNNYSFLKMAQNIKLLYENYKN